MKRLSIIIASLVVAFTFTLSVPIGQDPEITTIAVSSFQNNSDDPEGRFNFLGTGVSETLTTTLQMARISNLQVIERAQLERVLEEIKLGMAGLVDEESAPEIGKTLGAKLMILGDFQIVENQIRLNARVVNTETSKLVVAYKATGDYNPGLFSVQDDLADGIVQRLDPNAKAVQVKGATDSLEAYRFFSMGLNEQRSGKPREAVDYYLKAIEADGNYLVAFNNLGIAYFELGEYELAASNFSRAAEIDGNYFPAYNNLGNAYYKLVQKPDAIGAYNQAIGLNPDYLQAHFNLASTYDDEDVGSYDDAIREYKEVLRIDPRHSNSLYNLSLIFRNIKNDQGQADFYWGEYLKLQAEPFNVVFIIDSSKSMREKDPKELRKAGVKAFLQSAPALGLAVGKAGIVSFDVRATELSPMRDIEERDILGGNLLIEAVNEIGDSGENTNMAAGLRKGHEVLSNGPLEEGEIFAVFLTDGKNTFGDESLIIEAVEKYIESKWKVHTIGLSPDADRSLLTKIAADTGGNYDSVGGDSGGRRSLQSIFVEWRGDHYPDSG